jgi:hypothetical protein
MMYRKYNWTIEESEHYPYVPLLPQRTRRFNSVGKTDVIILPVTGKNYHVSRN